MKVIIDRFEGEYAIVELPDRLMVNIPRILVPGAKDGDVINISIDTAASADRNKEIEKLMDDVWE